VRAGAPERCGRLATAASAPEPPLQIVKGAERSRSLDLPKLTAPEAEADHEGGQQVAEEVTLQRQQLSEKIPEPLKSQTISYGRCS